ncbi:MAG: methionyl-tRNA formyltransferase [Gallionella sp.]
MKIIFAGTPQFAASAFAALLEKHQVVGVLTQPDRRSGRGMQLTPSPVKQLALQHGLKVLQPTTLKTVETQKEIEQLNADVMVVAAYGLILPKEVLEIPRYGCLNIHASLLPRWRGAAPIQRAILAGDSETGITIMQMDVGLDTGDMLMRHTCPILQADTAAELHDKLSEIGASSILEALESLEAKRLTPIKQDEAGAIYAAKLQKSEGEINWQQDAGKIERAVRAFNPFPVCRTKLNGVVIKIWQAKLIQQDGEPGVVLAVDKSAITVACGKDTLRLEILQRPGGKAQPAAQLLQAISVKAGDKFS